ncbi:hypothetical protein [Kamptonema sp. UHCC 0994]|uniref:hypothetical protein n=1 Tax=Kamptonema sp. UHCC 0994 TaxID=3031329 RepID=UPI0023B8C59B|nr:hypothetical protein [Kamptonema sp. UHCC 0994]MDF0552959.1 hypothetical protein [Kamptonema sp. UHCC 0994]
MNSKILAVSNLNTDLTNCTVFTDLSFRSYAKPSVTPPSWRYYYFQDGGVTSSVHKF